MSETQKVNQVAAEEAPAEENQEDQEGLDSKDNVASEEETEVAALPAKPPHKASIGEILIFTVLGISGILCWNAVLNGLSYFITQYPDYRTDFTLGVPQFFGQVVFGILMPYFSKKYEPLPIIALGLSGVSIGIFALTGVAAGLPEVWYGFMICEIISFTLGGFTTISQYSCIGLANRTVGTLITIYWGGTAWSGIVMNILQAIAYAIFPSDMVASALLYSGIAVLVSIIAILCALAFVKGKYYKEELYPPYLAQKEAERGQKQESLGANIAAGFRTQPILPAMMFINYIQTFLMFPGVSVFQHQFITDSMATWWDGTTTFSNDKWGQLLMLTLFNVGDLIGKYLSAVKRSQKVKVVVGLTMFRFLFFASFICISLKVNCDSILLSDVFCCINILLFAVLNGEITSLIFGIGPQIVNTPREMALVGFISNWSLQMGIMIGSFIALAFAKLPYDAYACPELYPPRPPPA